MSDPMDTINGGQAHICLRFGALMQILLCTERRTYKLASIAVQTLTAVKLNQVYVMHNERGDPNGYVLWAFVSDEVAAELASDPDRILHYSEWNEGLNLFIMDFVAPAGRVRELAGKMKNEILKDFPRVRGVHARADGSIRKVVDLAITRRSRGPRARADAPPAPAPAPAPVAVTRPPENTPLRAPPPRNGFRQPARRSR